jgi:hypothetical protein
MRHALLWGLAVLMVFVGYILVALNPTPVTWVTGAILFLAGIVLGAFTFERNQ